MVIERLAGAYGTCVLDAGTLTRSRVRIERMCQLGTRRKDLAPAGRRGVAPGGRELRQRVPDLEIDWLAQNPVTRVLEQRPAERSGGPCTPLVGTQSLRRLKRLDAG